MNRKPVIVIAGCTGSGKSDIALKLAKEINGVIINADSKQIYKEISIGTARPIPDKVEEDIWYIQGIKHYLYGYISINEKYNIYRYQQDVSKILRELGSNEIPILVGGTGLYIDSVIFNYKLRENSNNQLTERSFLKDKSIEELQKLISQEQLRKLNKSDRNNPRRLIRIIENGLPSTEKGEPLKHIYFIIDIEKDPLEERIITRVKKMFKNGLLQENKNIKQQESYKYSSLDIIGYKEFEDYFNNKKTLEEIEKDIVTHTKQYAKRQRTWFRKNPNAIYIKEFKDMLKKTKDFLSYYRG